jgi:hypothetical protein
MGTVHETMMFGPLFDERPNPFATARVRPGAIAYRFAPGESVTTLVDRLRACRWRGQIVGPHGSGKSTLLAALVPALEAAGRRTLLVPLAEDQRWLPRHVSSASLGSAGLLIVDGYERLCRPARWLTGWLCRARGWGLLATAHRDLGLPTLAAPRPDLPTAQAIVQSLLIGSDGVIAHAEVEEAWHRHGGNLREALFDLYDLYAERAG